VVSVGDFDNIPLLVSLLLVLMKKIKIYKNEYNVYMALNILISIPFFQRHLISTLCFTHYSMICKQVEQDLPGTSMKLVLVGSEGEVSRSLAMNFLSGPEYYIEFPQVHDKYEKNLMDKFKAAMECLKQFPHDLIFKMGSDDLITYDFFSKVINMYLTGKYDDHVFCNGVYSDAKKAGGIIMIDYDADNGFLIPMLGKVRDPTKSSMSMGAWAFTKKSIAMFDYDPGYSEIVIDRNIYAKKIPRTIVEQVFYDIKKVDQISCYTYNDYVRRHVHHKLNPQQRQAYIDFITKVRENIPEPLKYLFKK
jgi:hypothetical protein